MSITNKLSKEEYIVLQKINLDREQLALQALPNGDQKIVSVAKKSGIVLFFYLFLGNMFNIGPLANKNINYMDVANYLQKSFDFDEVSKSYTYNENSPKLYRENQLTEDPSKHASYCIQYMKILTAVASKTFKLIPEEFSELIMPKNNSIGVNYDSDDREYTLVGS